MRCEPPLAEFGIIAPQGIHRVEKLATQVHDPAVPAMAREALMLIVNELVSIWRSVEALEARLVALHRTNEVSRRLASIPGVGPITAMAIANTVINVFGIPLGPRVRSMAQAYAQEPLERR